MSSEHPCCDVTSVSRKYVAMLIDCRYPFWSPHPIISVCLQLVCGHVNWVQTYLLIIPSHCLCLSPASMWPCWLSADISSDHPILSSLSVPSGYVAMLIDYRHLFWSSHPIVSAYLQLVCGYVDWLQTSLMVILSHCLCLSLGSMWPCWLNADVPPDLPIPSWTTSRKYVDLAIDCIPCFWYSCPNFPS